MNNILIDYSPIWIVKCGIICLLLQIGDRNKGIIFIFYSYIILFFYSVIMLFFYYVITRVRSLIVKFLFVAEKDARS
jgi:hypothetical protein